jgi:hypothetical protein
MRTDGRLPPARAYALCEQVAAALDAAHAKGLVHRRADVYSLGCLFFECLTGEAPFTRESRLALAWAHLEEDPPAATARNGDLPSAIDGVLAKALAKSPADRYSSCDAFMRDAQQALGIDRPSGSWRLPALLVLAGVAVAAAVAFAVLRDHGAAAVPVVRENTLVRIDPATNKIRDVIEIGRGPVATAVGGASVWVYNREAHSLAEIDPNAKAVRRTIQLATDPVFVGVPKGPILAADSHGAWLVGVGRNGIGFLTNVRRGVRGVRRVRLDFEPLGVATGLGSVWVVGEKGSRGELVRVDPIRQTITARKLLPRPVELDNVTTGFGAVWGIDAARTKLYRIDARRLKLSRGVDVNGPNPGRPWAGFGDIWVAYDGDGSQGMLVNPTTLTVDLYLGCCPPRQGADTAAFGSYHARKARAS